MKKNPYYIMGARGSKPWATIRSIFEKKSVKKQIMKLGNGSTIFFGGSRVGKTFKSSGGGIQIVEKNGVL